MTDCTDTISPARPLEGVTTWLFRGVLMVARLGDRAIMGSVSAALKARERAAQRHMLASLDDRMLKDLGLSRVDVEVECRKPFWTE